MERKSFAEAPCSIARSLDILGDWWNPLIIRECLYGSHRFDELQHWLGIGRNILTRRLEVLTAAGLLERRQYETRPPRFDYHLTAKGYDAAKLLVAMMNFGEAWLFAPGHEPVRVYDRRTGRRVKAAIVDSETGEPLDPRELYAGPGPSFPRLARIRRERFKEYYQRNPKTE